MKFLLSILLFGSIITKAQNFKKLNDSIFKNIKKDISYLADDKLEGRRTGTAGEKLAYEYISNSFLATGLIPKGDANTYIQSFEVNEGKQIATASFFTINDNNLLLNKEYFPLVYTSTNIVETTCTFKQTNKNNIYFWDLKSTLEENKNNPHFDLNEAIKTKLNDVINQSAKALIMYNTSSINDELKFEPKAKFYMAKIPVLYLTENARKKYFENDSVVQEIKLKITIEDKKRIGHNVIGYINNNVQNTIIIGAHYDHLGYGEDHNSLYVGTTPQIHNGADDNASGTAALMALSKLLISSKYKNNNYLFISFSGEELGLYGSKYFTENPTIKLINANYMINMDMVGRLNDSTHGLTIGGYGTSPTWGKLLSAKNKYFTIKFDSSGSGPSDHTSFYRKDIPVLFFFTGVHSDYHKPSDDADKINVGGEVQVLKYVYNVIKITNKKGKLIFTKTREAANSGKSSFKVTLGIMPDYTFSGSGVRVDGVSDGKTAQKVGIKAGDVITQLGSFKFTDVQSYMQVLSKFNKGDATTVKLKRGTDELNFDIIF